MQSSLYFILFIYTINMSCVCVCVYEKKEEEGVMCGVQNNLLRSFDFPPRWCYFCYISRIYKSYKQPLLACVAFIWNGQRSLYKHTHTHSCPFLVRSHSHALASLIKIRLICVMSVFFFLLDEMIRLIFISQTRSCRFFCAYFYKKKFDEFL